TPVELLDDAQVVFVDKGGFTSGTVHAYLASSAGTADWGGGKLTLVVSNDGEAWEALALADLTEDGFVELPDTLIARWRFVGARISKSTASRKVRLTFHLVDDRSRASVDDGGASLTVDGSVGVTGDGELETKDRSVMEVLEGMLVELRRLRIGVSNISGNPLELELAG